MEKSLPYKAMKESDIVDIHFVIVFTIYVINKAAVQTH